MKAIYLSMLALVLLTLFNAPAALAQTTGTGAGTQKVDLTKIGGAALTGGLYDEATTSIRVNCVAGCAGGGGSGDGKVLDGTAAGEADVLGSTPAGTEQGLVVRNIPSGTQPVSGTVTANLGTLNGAATAAKQDTGNTSLSSIDSKLPSALVGNRVDVNVGNTPSVSVTNTPTVSLSQTSSANDVDATIVGTPNVSVTNTPTVAISQTTTANDVDATIVGTPNVAVTNNPVLGASTNNIGDVDVLTLPSVTIGTFPDDEPFNVSKINGVAPLMGNGVTGTGSPRVTVASDNTAIPAKLSQSTTDNDVDVVSQVPGIGATNLGKAEDAASASGDTGVVMYGIRKDTNAALTSADGDYTAFASDNYGAMFARSDHPNRIRCTVAVSTATTIQAVGGSCVAPGAGLSIYISDIQFSTSAAAATGADTFPTLKAGTGGTCGTGTIVIWGALTTANSTVVADLTTPIKLPANNELCWIMTTAGSKFLVLTGYIAN